MLLTQGFTVKGAPVLDGFLKVHGVFETTTSASILTLPTLLVHLHLKSIHHIAHFNIVHQLLSEYYVDDRLRVIDLPIDLGKDEDQLDWPDQATKIVARLGEFQHIVVFITTHSDPERGDLWLGQDEHERICSASVADVSLSFKWGDLLTPTFIVV